MDSTEVEYMPSTKVEGRGSKVTIPVEGMTCAACSGRVQRAPTADLQLQAAEMISMIYAYPFHAAMKTILNRLGFDLGNCRLPQPVLSQQQTAELIRRIDSMPFFG